MKTLIALAAIMGFSISVAAADCAGHAKVTTSVDTETKVASVVKQVPPLPVEEIKAEEAEQQQ